jgi:hypothetical protein
LNLSRPTMPVGSHGSANRAVVEACPEHLVWISIDRVIGVERGI